MRINPSEAARLDRAQAETCATSGPGRATRHRGSALLTVLWLSAALSAIAFSLANTVRGETERTATALDGAKTYYLAAGAIERAILYMDWGRFYPLPDGSSRYYSPWMPALDFSFPSGEARVEIIPENSKMNINSAAPEELFRLVVALGTDPDRAREIVQGIVDWRTPAQDPTPFDQYYLSLVPSFRARHSSFEEIEELLLIKGMTPELFYGTYEADAGGRLVPRGGLRDCVSVYGSFGLYDVNTVEPAVMASVGLSPELIAGIVETRRTAPFRNADQLNAFLQNAPGSNRFRIGGGTIYTLRATARLRLPNGGFSDQRRSVAALVKLNPPDTRDPYHVLRWYDNVWVR